MNKCAWCCLPIAPCTLHTPTSPGEDCTVTLSSPPPAPPSANQITAELLIEIPKLWPQVRVWRANVLAGKIGDRFVRAGVKGQGDLSGIGPKGIRIELEIKAKRDRMRPEQIAFRDMILRAGGIYIEARSVEQALRDLDFEIRRRG